MARHAARFRHCANARDADVATAGARGRAANRLSAADQPRIALRRRRRRQPEQQGLIGCHTDLVNWSAPAGYQLLHCLVNRAEDGQSIFVDGFSVAETLRQTDPDTFDLLASRPLPFRFHNEQSDIRIRAPLIAADERGNLVGVRFNLSLLDILDLPADTMDGVYQAYHKLAGLMRDPRFELRLRLGPCGRRRSPASRRAGRGG